MPFCPVCQAEYEAGVTVCADDGATLVEKLEEPDSGDFVEVHAFQFSHEAEEVRDLLLEEGIQCFLRDAGMSMMPTVTATVRLVVPAALAERAKEVIAAALAEQPSDDTEPEDEEETK